jgi:tryptophan-rich sensory protein
MSVSLADLSVDKDVPVLQGAKVPSVVCSPMSVNGHLSRKGFWMFMIVAVVVLVVLYMISRSAIHHNDDEGSSWWYRLDGFGWGKSSTLWGVLLVVGVLLFAWASFLCYVSCTDVSRRNMILAGFGLSMLALIALFSVLFRKDDCGNNTTKGLVSASWIAVLVMILGFATLVPLWSMTVARVAMIPYLVWTVAAVVYLWDLRRHNCD